MKFSLHSNRMASWPSPSTTVAPVRSDIFVDMVAALGASATPMPYGEVYTGIETGVIDGAENNFPSYDTAKHAEVAKYFSLDEHLIVPEVLVMSKLSWDRLSPEDQEIVRKAAKDSVEKQWELWDAQVAKSRGIVEAAGSTITEPDKQAFIDAMKPVYDKHVTDPKLQDLVKRIQETQ
jgi:TRAP-type C4-dicarboxylate transport system substrate-binding protein